MENEAKKRNRRTKDELKADRIQRYNEEIAKYKEKIAELEQKIKDEEIPPVTFKDVTAKIKEMGISPDEVIKLLEKAGKK